MKNLESNSKKNIFALVDCNSFYCSCERVFDPSLRKKPVIVLSNNDGCIVSLTPEAKKLGFKMGAPFFQFKDLVEKTGTKACSSNYSLYGDMSVRVMKTLSEFTPEIEIYSIDEAFLDLKGFDTKNLIDYATTIRKTVLKNTGLPVSVGIGPTKVLAKAANRIAKELGSGVFDITDPEVCEKALEKFPVENIWGVGYKSTAKLQAYGIRTAKQLRDANEQMIQKLLSIVGRRLLNELKGISCIDLDSESSPRKNILSSRSFGKPIFELKDLREAVSSHVTRSSEKLRSQKSVCSGLMVFIRTNKFKQIPQYFNSVTVPLLAGTDATNKLIAAAFGGLDQIYVPGYEYKKCGVILYDLCAKNQAQIGLFESVNPNSEKLMQVLDRVNIEMGTDSLKFASSGIEKKWKMNSEMRTPSYTTQWSDVLKIKI